MEHDAGEQREDEPHAFDHRRQAVTLVPVQESDPCDDDHERRMHVDVDPRDPRQFP